MHRVCAQCMRKSGVNTASKIWTVSAQKRFQGATQAFEAVGMVPRSSKGGSGRDMVSTYHMQKARVWKCHTVMYGCQTVSAVSGSLLLNRLYVGHFPLAHYRLGHNSKKLLGFGALFFAIPPGRKVSLHISWPPITLAETSYERACKTT